MRLAEIDPVQIVIIVLAMLGGFVQWLWGLIQQAREERNRRRAAPPDPEQQSLREEAWRRQVEPVRPSPQAPRPVNDAPPADPWEMVRRLMEKAQEAAQPPPERPAAPASRPAPPPLPEQRPAAPLRPAAPPHPAVAAVDPARATTPAVAATTVEPGFIVTPRPASRAPQTPPLTRLLARPESVRQAVLLREILGPPKALQSGRDAPI